MKYLPTVKNSKRHVDYCQGLCGNLNMSKVLQKKSRCILHLDFKWKHIY